MYQCEECKSTNLYVQAHLRCKLQQDGSKKPPATLSLDDLVIYGGVVNSFVEVTTRNWDESGLVECGDCGHIMLGESLFPALQVEG